VKSVEELECEDCLRLSESCWKPPGAEKLSSTMEKNIAGTITEVNRYVMDTIYIKYGEIPRARDQARTR